MIASSESRAVDEPNGVAPGPGHEAARLRLARISVGPDCPINRALEEVAATAAAALHVNRISIWRFAPDRHAICCDFLWQPDSRVIPEDATLYAKDFPGYFQSLQSRRVVAIADIDDDALTREFRDSYFRPLGITAMLDAPIYREGALVGVVCHEQIGPPRRWSEHDCEFAATAADIIARLQQEGARLLAEHELSAYRERLANLQRLDMLGCLAAGAAHDFKNVLHAIAGYAEEIAEAAAGQARIASLSGDLIKAVDRGIGLARELQGFGRGEAACPSAVALESVIASARFLLARAAGPNVEFDFRGVQAVGKVFVDPERIERVLLNLVLNARDAMPAGGTIAVALRESAAGGGLEPPRYIVLSVSDNGIGMDDATRRRIFEPLFTTKGGRGTGLGLPLVNQIVTQAGGFVQVESAVGRGTTVRVHLPRIG